MPSELLFDQMKAVIIEDGRGNGGRLAEKTESLRFSVHWGFGSGPADPTGPRRLNAQVPGWRWRRDDRGRGDRAAPGRPDRASQQPAPRGGHAFEPPALRPDPGQPRLRFPAHGQARADRRAAHELGFLERISLAITAAESGRKIYFGTLTDLVDSLEEAKAAGRLNRRLNTLTHPALLVDDEIGYLPVTQSGAILFFQLINRR